MAMWSDLELITKAAKNSTSISGALMELGCSPKVTTNARKFKQAVTEFGIDISHFTSLTSKRNWDKKVLQQHVNDSLCMADVLEKMGLVPRSGNYSTLKNKLVEYNICTAHFDSVRAGQRNKTNKGKGPIPIQEILLGQHPNYRTNWLKKRLVREGIKADVCESCGLTGTWNNKPIVLELDHIDGNSKNHKLENLQLLCPNCHSQTDTYKGRNKGL